MKQPSLSFLDFLSLSEIFPKSKDSRPYSSYEGESPYCNPVNPERGCGDGYYPHGYGSGYLSLDQGGGYGIGSSQGESEGFGYGYGDSSSKGTWKGYGHGCGKGDRHETEEGS